MVVDPSEDMMGDLVDELVLYASCLESISAPPLPSWNVAIMLVEVTFVMTGALGALLSRGIVGSVTVEFMDEVKLPGVSQDALPTNLMLPTPVASLW
jgi:hypothetical protein